MGERIAERLHPWAPEGLAVWIASEANRLIADHVAQAPDRLTGLGLVTLQHPSRMLECLDDAVLGRGLAGVEISSFAGDVELSDERLEPFWARAAELGAVIFLHPFGSMSGSTASTFRTPSASRPRTRWRCRT